MTLQYFTHQVQTQDPKLLQTQTVSQIEQIDTIVFRFFLNLHCVGNVTENKAALLASYSAHDSPVEPEYCSDTTKLSLLDPFPGIAFKSEVKSQTDVICRTEHPQG